MVRLKRVSSILAILGVLSLGAPFSRASAQTIGPDGTPQVERSSETLRYVDAAPGQFKTIYTTVLKELSDLPERPSPDQSKGSDLRKRILDLRLLMDFYAFLYEPGPFEAFRDSTDAAYEQIGGYKDIFDAQKIDRSLNDENYLNQRFTKMIVSIAPFRSGAFREDVPIFLMNPADRPLNLQRSDQPQLWVLAGIKPDDSLDSAGNVAKLAVSVLKGFRESDVLVKDILNPDDEAKFHFARKVLRSVEVLVDMFPSLSDQVADVREPLDDVIGDMGDTNDEYVAFHLSELFDRDLAPRKAGVNTSYVKALASARLLISSGALDAYIARLDAARSMHKR